MKLFTLSFAFAALLMAAPVQAHEQSRNGSQKGGHSHNDGGRHDHGKGGGRGHGGGHVETRSCGSHKHHHSHVWEGQNHRKFKCLGHE